MTTLPERWRGVFALNPLAGVVEGYRAALLPAAPLAWSQLGVAAVLSVVLFLAGVTWFRRAEREFADLA
jgi:lipopolysaccharide transport system permease protein